MNVSIIVPAYNCVKTIVPVVEALRAQDYSHPFEIIIVDDGSTDETENLIKQFPDVKYIYQPNAGPAVARNHGARVSTGEILCFTDSDCIAHKNWVSMLVAGFNAPDIAVVSGSYGIANPEHILARGIHGEIIFRHKTLLGEFPKVFGSYNFGIKRGIFEQIGGFEEKYRNASGEDNDLSYKVIKTGQKIRFESQALVDHYHTTGVVKYLKEQFRHGFWRVNMYVDHPDMAKGDDYTFWKDIIEVPWAGACVLGVVLSALGIISFKALWYFLIVPLFIFEIFFQCRILNQNISSRINNKFFERIFFSFVMFLRAFARGFGLSTGIFNFLLKKMKKKFK